VSSCPPLYAIARRVRQTVSGSPAAAQRDWRSPLSHTRWSRIRPVHDRRWPNTARRGVWLRCPEYLLDRPGSSQCRHYRRTCRPPRARRWFTFPSFCPSEVKTSIPSSILVVSAYMLFSPFGAPCVPTRPLRRLRRHGLSFHLTLNRLRRLTGGTLPSNLDLARFRRLGLWQVEREDTVLH
jgi:hypothetical protein